MGTRTGIATGRPTAAATWFEAATPFGPLRLRVASAATASATTSATATSAASAASAISAASAACAGAGHAGVARHAADAAIVLGEAEELLAALDAWAGGPLDWRWSPAPKPMPPAGAAACVHWRGPAHQIVCPWAWLRALPPPEVALAGIARQLHWPAVDTVLGIARLCLGDDDWQQLEPGGAVLLPPSLMPGWQGALRSAGEPALDGAGVAVDLRSPAAPRLVPGRAAAAAPGTAGGSPGRWCEVRLVLPHPLGGASLAGWCDDVLDTADLQAGLWSCAGEGRPEHCLAEGRLIPWGDGWALALATVRLEPPAAEHMPSSEHFPTTERMLRTVRLPASDHRPFAEPEKV